MTNIIKQLRIGVAALALVAPLSTASFTTASAQSITMEELGPMIRQYILDNPGIILEAYTKHQQEEDARRAAMAAEAVKSHGEDIYNSPTTPTMGNAEGDVAVVEFFDYNCGYCKRAATGLFSMIEKDAGIKLVLKELPILGPSSRLAAEAALAAQMQGKYDPFHREMIQFKGGISQRAIDAVARKVGMDVDQMKLDMKSDYVTQELEAVAQLASVLGVNGTPAFIVNDQVIPGAVDPSTLQEMVNAARNN